MTELETVIAKIEEYVKIVGGREQVREQFRTQSFDIVRQMMKQTNQMVSRLMKNFDNTQKASEKEQKVYYARQYREVAESKQRWEAAVKRRGQALNEVRAALEERGN